MSHIIGRPDDGLLDVMLGPGGDPEQAIVAGSGPGPEDEGEQEEDGSDDRRP